MSAVRTDPHLGVRETVEFIGTGPDRIFYAQHAPLEPARAGVVVCPSIYADFTSNYRRELLVARTLARRGLAVARLHYRGTGNSDGDPNEATLASHVEDAVTAALRLAPEASGQLAFFGLRWGATVAASASRSFAGAPLVLWDPPDKPIDLFQEALRARMIREVKDRVATPPSSKGLVDELLASGSLDVLGHLVHRRLYQSAEGRLTGDELGPDPRPVLLVLAEEAPGNGGSSGLMTDLAERGWPVRTAVLGRAEPWWFHGQRNMPAEDVAEPLAEVVDTWLSKVQAQ